MFRASGINASRKSIITLESCVQRFFKGWHLHNGEKGRAGLPSPYSQAMRHNGLDGVWSVHDSRIQCQFYSWLDFGEYCVRIGLMILVKVRTFEDL